MRKKIQIKRRVLVLSSFFLFFLGAMVDGLASEISSLKGTELKSCLSHQSKCVVLKSDSLVGSHLRPLYSFKEATVTVIEGKRQTEYQAKLGYWDAKGNLLYFRDGNSEFSVDLSSLKIDKFALGIK